MRAAGGEGYVSIAQLAELYTGAFPTFYRTTLMLGSFFTLCDYFERFAPDLMAVPLLGGACLACSPCASYCELGQLSKVVQGDVLFFLATSTTPPPRLQC